MENILTGTYININSPIHKLNVKYKMPCLILALAFTVISNNAVMYSSALNLNSTFNTSNSPNKRRPHQFPK